MHTKHSIPKLLLLASVPLALIAWMTVAASGSSEQTVTSHEVSAYPQAPRDATVDTYHGVEIADPYRPLEDLEAPVTQEWLTAQASLTQKHLGGEVFERHRQRFESMLGALRYNRASRRGEHLFLTRTRGSGSNELTHLVATGDGEPEILLDPAKLKNESAYSYVFSPSPSGDLVAYGVRRPGSSWNRVRLLALNRSGGKLTPSEELVGIHSGYGALAWDAEGRGFYYSRFEAPAPGEELTTKPAGGRVLYHRVGTPQSADLLVHHAAKDEQDRWFIPQVSDDGHYLVVRTARAADAGHRVLVADLHVEEGETPNLAPLIETAENVFYFKGNSGPVLFFHTDHDAPRGRVVGIDPRRPAPEHWQEAIPENGDVIRRLDMVGGRFLVSYVRDTLPRIAVFAMDGKHERDLDLPLGISWNGFSGRQDDAWAYFQLSGLADPGTLYRAAPASGRVEIVQRPELDFDPADFVIKRVKYPSHDGTEVPMFLASRRGLEKTPETPVFLYAYGAFGWSAFPWFQPNVVAFMEAGGVYALAGVRGGGEYGKEWHEAGSGRNKEVGIADFLAAADWLVEKGWTSPRKLVVNGGSASGVMAGAAMLRRPDLFAAAVIDIPVLDMLRFEESQRGEYWVPDFGTVADEKDFLALRRYSPLHNLRAGTCYPPTLVTVGERDEVASPWLAYKFMAALQDIQECASPALLQVVEGAGHSFGTSREQTAVTLARQLTFLETALGEASTRSEHGTRCRDLGGELICRLGKPSPPSPLSQEERGSRKHGVQAPLSPGERGWG